MTTVMGDHAATHFGNFAIRVAEYWRTLKPQDGDKKKTRHAHRRHQCWICCLRWLQILKIKFNSAIIYHAIVDCIKMDVVYPSEKPTGK